MKKQLLIIIVFILGFSNLNFSQYYTPAQISAIHVAKSGTEGDMYKDTTNDLQYIGVTDGSLKLLSPHYVRVIQKTGNHTLTMGESGAVITFNSATPVTLTVPALLPVGYNVSVYQTGLGQVTIVGAVGVTVVNRLSIFKTAGKDAGVGIVSTATSYFHVTGDLTK